MGDRQSERQTDHLLPCNADVKEALKVNLRNVISRCATMREYADNFTCTLNSSIRVNENVFK
jgi:hypothetical protein